jgi:hypothetical protein
MQRSRSCIDAIFSHWLRCHAWPVSYACCELHALDAMALNAAMIGITYRMLPPVGHAKNLL